MSSTPSPNRVDPDSAPPADRTPQSPAKAAAPAQPAGQPATAPATPAQPAARPAPGAQPAAQPQAQPKPQPTPQPQRPAQPAAAAAPAKLPAAAHPTALQPRPVTPLPAAPPGPPPPGGATARPLAAPAGAARPRRRHWLLMVSFILLVLLPIGVAAWYLWTRAANQYVSTMAFSVRKEDQKSGIDILGGITAFTSAAGASDTSILDDYIRSPDMVQAVMASVDLPASFSGHWPRDFVYAYNPEGTIEDLVDYWNRQVTVINDDKTGIMTVKVSAFSPDDAQHIAQAVFDASSATVNRLSDQAREDATRYAREELQKAETRVGEVRAEMTEFRTRTQLVDPKAEFESRLGILTQLQSELASALVAQDMLTQNGARDNDPRIEQSKKRISAIEDRIEAERQKFSAEGSGPGGESYARLVAEFERLTADREFSEQAYTVARASYDAALADAQRQTRYLAAHIAPNLPQQSLRPDRPLVLAIFAAFVLLGWAILALVYYSVRDRG